MDEVEGSKAMNVGVKNEATLGVTQPALYKQRDENVSIVGTDVEALFPSIPDIESSKVVRCAILESEIDTNNVDCHKALLHLRLVGGQDYQKMIKRELMS